MARGLKISEMKRGGVIVFYVPKPKGLINCAVVFVFAYAINTFPHDAAQMIPKGSGMITFLGKSC